MGREERDPARWTERPESNRMSVFLEHRRGSDYEASPPRRGLKRPAKPAGGDDAPLWGFSYDRAEGVIHLLLAFTMVGGAAAMLWTLVAAPEPKVAEKPAAPVKVATAPAPAEARATAEKAPAPIVKAENKAEPAPVASSVAAPVAAPIPAPVAAPAMAMAAAMSPISIANAPAPLAPPPADVRARLVASAETPARPVVTTRETEPEAPAAEAPAQKSEEAPAQASASEGERTRAAHCYVKLSGRVQTNATCQVQITENGIIFQIPGKPLSIEHVHGRTWVATLGGRALGNVYKSGSCWGGHGFYACKNG